MKKLLILLVVIFASGIFSNINAQTEKGSLILGSLNYNSGNLNQDFNFITFNPHIGSFVGNNFALGFSFSFLWEFEKGNNELVNAIAPYMKIYFGKGERGKYFMQLKPALALRNFEFKDAISGIAINAGYSYFISKAFTMDYSMQFTKARYTNAFISLNVGVNFHIKSKD